MRKFCHYLLSLSFVVGDYVVKVHRLNRCEKLTVGYDRAYNG